MVVIETKTLFFNNWHLIEFTWGKNVLRLITSTQLFLDRIQYKRLVHIYHQYFFY